MTSFSLFSGATLYFLLALLFARYSPFYLCPLLFSFAFLSPYSAYFGVLSNFLARFSGLASTAPLPPPSPFHYVMSKIVLVVQLAAHAKSSTLYGRMVARSYNQIFSAWRVTMSCNYWGYSGAPLLTTLRKHIAIIIVIIIIVIIIVVVVVVVVITMIINTTIMFYFREESRTTTSCRETFGTPYNWGETRQELGWLWAFMLPKRKLCQS